MIFEVLTSVLLKISITFYVKPCRLERKSSNWLPEDGQYGWNM
jgi:hypothetical protein